jgi:hypothetical protein
MDVFKLGMMTYVLKWAQITTIQNFYHFLIEYLRKHERYWTAFFFEKNHRRKLAIAPERQYSHEYRRLHFLRSIACL